nr:MAG TPA: PAB-dependent polyA-specific ribonuclease subunit [Caudoviricetes sp.]
MSFIWNQLLIYGYCQLNDWFSWGYIKTLNNTIPP